MTHRKVQKTGFYRHALYGILVFSLSATVSAQESREALAAEIKALKAQLAEAETRLANYGSDSTEEDSVENANTAVSDDILLPIAGGTLKVGGAIRANYAIGDYPETGAASRAGEDDGNFALDTFRVNLDYSNDDLIGKLEYRWYNGYNFLHTGWLGYNFSESSQLQVGVNRVPFGPGPYGVSQSWFFDQHYYLGLADDMDLGVKYSSQTGNLSYDIAYYYSDEGTYTGGSKDSARYSYDVVNESGSGYEERNQFNVRAIQHIDGDVSTDLGISLQYGELKSRGPQSDGDHAAYSLHMVNKWQGYTLASQLTYFNFDVDSAQSLSTDNLVQMGAYDFPNTVAAEGWIPAISLSYYHETSGILWLDYVIPYLEYSSIVKRETSFNDSEMVSLGAAWGHGGWFIYTDLTASNGNEFIGGDAPYGDRLGANAAEEWMTRFNINFGYYF